MFVTLLYGVLDFPFWKFTYSREGHLPPIILDGDGNLIEVKVRDGQALGLLDNPKLNQQEVIIPPGGLILLFSDGLNESVNTKGEEFGIERVRKELVHLRHLGASQICEGLWESAFNFCGDANI